MKPDTAVIEPRRGKREEALPPLGILAFVPQDLDLLLGSLPGSPKRSHRIFLTDVFTCAYHDIPLAVAGPMLGAPQAVMVLEKLIALGVHTAVAIGWCGSLQSHVHIGDVVLPVGTLSEEGTSGHYPIPVPPAPAFELLSLLRGECEKRRLRIHEGRVWTTDAPYRETVGKVLKYHQEGILAVDMESSALFTAAEFRGIRMAMALAVSDELAGLEWRHGFRNPRLQQAREKLVQVVLEAVCAKDRMISSPS